MYPATMDAATKTLFDYIETYGTTYREQYLQPILNDNVNIFMLSLNDPRNDWTFTDMTAWRKHYFERTWFNNHSGRPPPDNVPHFANPPTGASIETFVTQTSDPWVAQWITLYEATPKFSWHWYMVYFQHVLAVNFNTTFQVHPNGSWSYFDNSYLYWKAGAPVERWGDAIVYSNQLTADFLQCEHVIHDRIHLEFRTFNGLAAAIDTTHVALHNQAVRAGKEAKTLADGIEEITEAGLRGSFTGYTMVTMWPVEYPAFQIAYMQFTWDGDVSYHREGHAQNDADTAQLFNSYFYDEIHYLNLSNGWQTTATHGGDGHCPTLSEYHVRFCDFMILQNVKER
jgi:hypothetical protein